MERLGDIVARVLANVRATMDGEMAGGAAGEAAPPLAREAGGGTVHARKGEAHPRSSSRSARERQAKNRAARDTVAP